MVPDRDARAAPQEQPDDILVPVYDSVHQGGMAEDRRLLIDEGAMVEQEIDHVGSPDSAALWRAVAPARGSTASTCAPAVSSRSTICDCPRAAAIISGVSPSGVKRFTSAPSRMSAVAAARFRARMEASSDMMSLRLWMRSAPIGRLGGDLSIREQDSDGTDNTIAEAEIIGSQIEGDRFRLPERICGSGLGQDSLIQMMKAAAKAMADRKVERIDHSGCGCVASL